MPALSETPSPDWESNKNLHAVSINPPCSLIIIIIKKENAIYLTSFGLNSSGELRRYMVMRACVAVGTLLSFRLNLRSPSEPRLC